MQPLPSPDWGALIFQSFLRAFWPYFVLAGIVLVAKGLFYRWKLNRIAQSGIEDIDRMSGLEFEQYLEALFTRLGYQVERTPYVGDYGADLVVRKEGVKTVIQAKRHKSRVGAKAIGEVLRAKGNYGCSSAMLVTNSSYTRQAEEEARTNGIELWDRNELIRRLLSVKASDELKGSGSKPPAQPPLKNPPRSLSSVSLPPNPHEKATHEATPLSGEQPEAMGAGMSDGTCIVCGKAVSEKVKQYCKDHPYKFGGHIYCFEHQRSRSSS